MDQIKKDKLVRDCVAIALKAGREILSVEVDNMDLERKVDGTPVTRADRASHECITSGLSKLGPGFDLLSEEGDIRAFLERGSQVFWLVDPLDGTREFVKGLGEYTVNIALVEHGSPVLGVVYAPATSICWYGTTGSGAYRFEKDSAPERIFPVDRKEPKNAVVSRSHLSDRTRRFLELNGITETISRGSSIKICAVAEGSSDIYPRHGPTCIWDTAAGTAVARSGGCRVVDGEGADLNYDPAGGIRREMFIVFPEGMKYREVS